jgi:hypothetical protein
MIHEQLYLVNKPNQTASDSPIPVKYEPRCIRAKWILIFSMLPSKRTRCKPLRRVEAKFLGFLATPPTLAPQQEFLTVRPSINFVGHRIQANSPSGILYPRIASAIRIHQ